MTERTHPDESRWSLRRGALAVAVALLVLSSTVAFATGGAVAGDQVAVISPEESTVAVEPGDTFEVDVVMRSQGGHDGEGIGSVTLVSQYHPAYLEITDVEAGSWLEGDDGADVRVERTLAHEDGTAIIDQSRTAGGTTGNEVLATLTVAVADDAPASEATISFGESAVELERGWPVPVHDGDVTVEIDGGGEAPEPFEHPDPESDEVADAGEADERADDRDDPADDADDDSSESTADQEPSTDDPGADDGWDALPGFTLGIAALALLGALAAFAVARRRSR